MYDGPTPTLYLSVPGIAQRVRRQLPGGEHASALIVGIGCTEVVCGGLPAMNGHTIGSGTAIIRDDSKY